jgi:hypothetical protein
MAKIQRFDINNDIEKRIVTGLIVSDEFCTSIQKMIRKQYFQIDYARTIVDWILDYYRLYKKAPGKEIQSLFKAEISKSNIRESEAILIEHFLSSLSADYESNSSINNEFLLDQSRTYFRERSLTLLSEKVQNHIVRGKIDQAELEVKNFSRVVKELGTWFNPFDKSNVRLFFDDTQSTLLRLPDELGELSGDLEREWLVAFMGPMKRGKSWMLMEFAIHALTHGLKVVFFSLEMSQRVLSRRIYKRITALSEKPGMVSWPVFDCENNQDNSCKRDDRTCVKGIKPVGVDIVNYDEFKNVKGYKPCTVCKQLKNGLYKQAIWKIWKEQKETIESKAVLKKIKDFERLYGNNFRIKAYPSFTATLDDIVSDLDDLWYTEGFAPDVICIDSLDITASENKSGLSERGQIDWSWKRAKGLAGKRKALVATVLQSNRASISQDSVQQDNTSEDIRKLAHVDVMMGLNQTPEEKKKGIMRISDIAHRHEGFTFGKEAIILQNFDLGQPLLDSQWYESKKKKEEK